MKKVICCIILISQMGFAAQKLKQNEIPRIMLKLMSFHVEAKELSPGLIRRFMKLYVHQYDPEKIYFLESEVLPFLNISNQGAKEIADRIRIGNFSDFIRLENIMEKAVSRSRALRSDISSVLSGSALYTKHSYDSFSSYASSESELKKRLQKKLLLFYMAFRSESPKWTNESSQRLVMLFEGRLRRGEKPFMGADTKTAVLTPEEREHLVSLQILKAFAKSLDAHSAFFSEDEAKQMRLSLEKEFEGFGVVLSEGLKGTYISSVIKGSPAHKSGLIHPSDLLIAIDGHSVEKMTFEDVLKKMKRGKKRSITLSVKNHNGTQDVRLTKAPIVMQEERLQYSAAHFGNGVIGKIVLQSFYENSNGITSEKDLRAAITALQKQGPLKGLVLDLRENSGGFLSQAVKVASLFISSGVVVVSKYGKREAHVLRAVDKKAAYNGPLIILTSKMSASAAEIVSQALQDYGSALIVGDERTFGKGSIQYQTVTDSKADYFFKVTIGRYYTVSGKSTQIHGVKPDIFIPTHYSPFSIGEKFLDYPLPADQIAPIYKDPLSDLTPRAKKWFEKNYLPHLQKKIVFWQKMIPTLRKNSIARLKNNTQYQSYLQILRTTKEKIDKKEPLPANPMNNYGFYDLHMEEAVYILQDMIMLEAKSRKDSGLSYTENGKPPKIKAA
jgi:carboxyl-terminal processing protease